MLQVQTVIAEGFDAYTAGRSILSCPYSAPKEPCLQMAYHGGEPIGYRRVAIDFRQLWHNGYNLAQLKDDRDATQGWRQVNGRAKQAG
jgi:hypothetical protein